jgi:ribonuclease HIII
VDAASILASERFIDWMDAASQKTGFTIPLGASSAVVDAGKKLVGSHGEGILGKFAKLHFKTARQVMGELP